MIDCFAKLENVSISYFLPKIHRNGIKIKMFEEYVALKNINFEFAKGSRTGLVGSNGSGKSTLLKLLSGNLTPNNGKLTITQKTASILELAGGINGVLTGYENARLKYYQSNSMLSWNEFKSYIEKATQLGERLSSPVSTYSSGMKNRLDRSLLALIGGDAYLFDEWIGVLDSSITNTNDFKINNNKTIIVASHSEHVLREWTTDLIWLKDGEIEDYGPIDNVLKKYQSYCKQPRT